MLKYVIEIRNKFILLTITFFSTLSICYWYKDVLLFLLTQMHINDENLYFIFTDVTELASVYFRLIFFITVQTTIWYSVFHIFSFLATALYPQEFKFIKFLLKGGTFFWFFSCLLSSYILIPFGWRFFLSFQYPSDFYFEARISEYLNFYNNAYVMCVVYFQSLTLFFVFLLDIQYSHLYIRRYRKLYYYAFLIFATLITPPDLISQTFATFFAVLAYESLLLLTILNYWLQHSNSATNLN